MNSPHQFISNIMPTCNIIPFDQHIILLIRRWRHVLFDLSYQSACMVDMVNHLFPDETI